MLQYFIINYIVSLTGDPSEQILGGGFIFISGAFKLNNPFIFNKLGDFSSVLGSGLI